MFVNDTTLFLNATPNNLQKTFQVLQTFCDASKGRINWHKSCAKWASKEARHWFQGEDKGLTWLKIDNKTK